MGIAFSYQALLKAHYTRVNIKRILKKGIYLGMEYYSVDGSYKFTNVNEAVDALMVENIYGTYTITGKIDGHMIFISSHPRDFETKELGIVIGDFYEINTVEYMRFFVEMIRDFAIYDIQMDIE